MRRPLVSALLADVTQHIHSLRASGVMLAHTSATIASDWIALRKSGGIVCTVPEAIGCRAMLYRGFTRERRIPSLVRLRRCWLQGQPPGRAAARCAADHCSPPGPWTRRLPMRAWLLPSQATPTAIARPATIAASGPPRAAA